MKRRTIISQEAILDQMQISTVAGVGSGMMTQYLTQARMLAVKHEFPEYQAMALSAKRQPDGSVEIETPFEEIPKCGGFKGKLPEFKAEPKRWIPTDLFPWIIGWLGGIITMHVWEVVTSCGG
jgi:hypothetical protein